MKYSLQSVLFAVLAGVAVNAHALCVNADGTLDDASVPKETIAVDMLPACTEPEAKAAGPQKAEATPSKQQDPAPAQPADLAKTHDKRASLAGDCQTAYGESRLGYIGAAELLPVCRL